jgi:hypothetical protein
MADPALRDGAVTTITSALAAAQHLKPPTYVDLYDFSGLLAGSVAITPIQADLKAITIAEYHGSRFPGAHGLNIVFIDLPMAVAFSTYLFDYTNFDPATGKGSKSSFINDYSWDEMMNSYFYLKYPNLMPN